MLQIILTKKEMVEILKARNFTNKSSYKNINELCISHISHIQEDKEIQL